MVLTPRLPAAHHGAGQLLLAISLIGLAACGPDFSRPGDDGGTAAVEPSHGLEYITSGFPPAVPPCDVEHRASASARQGVISCDRYNFTPLYNRALAAVDDMIQGVSCPTDCQPVESWISSRIWNCDTDFFGSGAVAFAAVEKTFRCPSANAQTAPAGLGAPDPDQLASVPASGPHLEPAGGPPPRTPRGVIEDVGPTTTGAGIIVSCSAPRGARSIYTERVPACAGLDYEPVVTRAEEVARRWHASLPCEQGCPKQPFRTLRREWSCDSGTARVNVFFEVHCRR